ncbi:MAG: threonine synthase [Candidatus Poribacteria bacterium]
MTYLTHLECGLCGKLHPATEPQNLCTSCGKPLLARYDLEALAQVWNKATLADRHEDMWRYREILPITNMENIVSLGETMTPLLRAKRLGDALNLKSLWIKDESRLPTGTFKARGLAMAVSKAKEFGLTDLAIPSAGNAATALSVYAARAGMCAHIFMPEDAPSFNAKTTQLAGAQVELVNGLITDAGRIVAERKEQEGWFDVSTLKEPYRVEGKKTMGLELAEQLGWRLPDVIIYPTGGGTGIVGMWKAFDELEQLGWIDAKRPRMVSVQSTGCAPIVRAFHEGKSEAEFWENASTIAAGLRVPKAIGDFLILNALRQSFGTAVAVSDDEILDAMSELASREGILSCPEGAATVAGLKTLLDKQMIEPDEEMALFNTGGFAVREL